MKAKVCRHGGRWPETCIYRTSIALEQSKTLKKMLPILLVFALTLSGFVAALVVNTALGFFIAPPADANLGGSVVSEPVASGERVEPSRPSTRRANRSYVRSILRRSIFDHSKAGQQVTTSPGSDEELPATDLKLALLATVVAEPAEYSSALIVVEEEDSAVYGIEMEVAGATIVEIHDDHVVLMKDGERQILRFDEKAKPKKKKRGTSSSDDEEGITEVSDTEFEIDRSLVDKYLADPDGLAKLGSARPYRRGGETLGFKLTRIKSSSLAGKIGIKNGDIVHAVNGQPLTSMKEAMGAYDTLQSSSNFSFEITRRGKKMNLNYSVK